MTRSSRTSPPHRAGLSVVSVVSALAVASGALAGCSDRLPPSGNPPPSVSTPSPTTDSTIGLPDDPLVLVGPDLAQEGSADVTVATSTLDDGVVRTDDRSAVGDGGGPALRFPAFMADPAADYPRAVVTVANAGAGDQFDPGAGPFALGVDFNTDGRSTGRDDDNGNNLIQRGLSSDDALYKLEIDANMKPTCTVRGTQGTVIVRSTLTALPGRWYRVRCARNGDRLSIEVGRVLPDGSAVGITVDGSGPIGVVTMGDPAIPISIGGKVAHNGAVISSASDQFNGLLRNPFVALTG